MLLQWDSASWDSPNASICIDSPAPIPLTESDSQAAPSLRWGCLFEYGMTMEMETVLRAGDIRGMAPADIAIWKCGTERKRNRSFAAPLAGAVRFELTTKVLETHVLPLHHAPTFSRTYVIILQMRGVVNSLKRKKCSAHELRLFALKHRRICDPLNSGATYHFIRRGHIYYREISY